MADANFITKHVHIIPRKLAKSLGLKRYFTGNPCAYGHAEERLTVNGSCVGCSREKGKRAYWANRDEDLARQKAYREANRDKILSRRHEVRMRDEDYVRRQTERARARALRQAAIDAGEMHYWTGAPCSQGHIALRFARDGKCAECNRIACTERHKARAEAEGKQYRPLEEIMRIAAAKRVKVAKERKEKRDTSAWHIAAKARAEARRLGNNTYMSPKACSKGHVGLRYYPGGGCVTCSAEFAASAAKKEYDKIYYAQNFERIKARSKEYVQRNWHRVLENCRAWAKRNPEKRRAIADNYKHRRRAWEEGGASALELFRWKMAQKKVCYWCGKKCGNKYHIDHYAPLSKGGRHAIDNLVIACPSCNHRKSAKDPYEFAAQVGRLF